MSEPLLNRVFPRTTQVQTAFSLFTVSLRGF